VDGFTHIKGYPSAVGPVQTSESSPVRDRHSTTEPPNQLGLIGVYGTDKSKPTTPKVNTRNPNK